LVVGDLQIMAAFPRGVAAALAPVALALAILAPAPASAAETTPAAPPPADADAWRFDLSPYVWFIGLDGDVAVSSHAPPAHVSATFSQLLGDLKFAFMLQGEARHDRFVAIGDLIYTDVQTSTHVGVRDPEFLNVRLTNKQLITTLLAGYRVMDHGDSALDLLAGGRVQSLDDRLDLEGSVRKVTASGSLTWVDPVVAARLRGPLAPHWSYTVYGDVGGASGLTWQVLGLVSYRASPRWTVSGGWRHLAIDHHDNDFLFDVAMDGPILGASYRF
jgi:hypothetical protein